MITEPQNEHGDVTTKKNYDIGGKIAFSGKSSDISSHQRVPSGAPYKNFFFWVLYEFLLVLIYLHGRLTLWDMPNVNFLYILNMLFVSTKYKDIWFIRIFK